jgi:probable rRNA maturation factor
MSRLAATATKKPIAPEEIAAPAIDVVVQSDLWAAEPGAAATVRRALAAAAASRPAPAGAEVTVMLTDDADMQRLNRAWRGIDKPTNVLSFPAINAMAPALTNRHSQDPPLPEGRENEPPALLGDVVLAYETIAREAASEEKPVSHHLAHLAVHGFLHLLGYDHDSKAAATEMEALESEILARLAIPDPYGN